MLPIWIVLQSANGFSEYFVALSAAYVPHHLHELAVFGAGERQVDLVHEQAIHLLTDLFLSVLLLLLRLFAECILLKSVCHCLHHLLNCLFFLLRLSFLLLYLEPGNPFIPQLSFSFELLEEL